MTGLLWVARLPVASRSSAAHSDASDTDHQGARAATEIDPDRRFRERSCQGYRDEMTGALRVFTRPVLVRSASQPQYVGVVARQRFGGHRHPQLRTCRAASTLNSPL